MRRERFNPKKLNIAETRERALQDPAFAKAYGALEDEFTELSKQISARHEDHAAAPDRPGSLGETEE